MGKISCLQGDQNFLERLRNEPATFFLVGAHTETAEIPGITVAGLPGHIGYTPALDYEMLSYGMPKSMPDIALSPEGPPSPVLITVAVQNRLKMPKFFVDAGVQVQPKTPYIYLDSAPGKSMLQGAEIPFQKLFEKGRELAAQFAHLHGMVYLAECVPGGTTTAYAVTKALEYACDTCFSSSTNSPETRSIKKQTVERALKKHQDHIRDAAQAVFCLGDPMQPVLSGMAYEFAKQRLVVLAGGTQMAAVYAILSSLDEKPDFSHIALMTTRWVVEDQDSDMAGLLQMIDPSLNAFYADFSLETSQFANLRLYEEGLVKEGVGAGAMLCHAFLNGVSGEQIVQDIDGLFKGLAPA